MGKYKKGNVVYYLFGEAPHYKIMSTKKQPLEQPNGQAINVAEGSDYIIMKTSLTDDELGSFLHVPESHLQLISDS